jgi:CDP-diacylglycerol--serine O-phosphatidyltransferase
MVEHKPSRKDKLKKGIYILPNAFTSLNIFCGFFAIIASINSISGVDRFESAAIAILIAVIFDSLDGKIARVTHTTSQFGIEYDSLSDLVSFGLAPSLMMYVWVLKPMGRIGWLAAFLFTTCGALRLARFNAMADETPSSHFMGLPIPAAAAMCATTVLFCSKYYPAEFSEYPVVFLVGIYFLSFLMVCTIKYESFKKAELFQKMSFNVLVKFIFIIIVIAQKPQMLLFAIIIIYISSGPIHSLYCMIRTGYEKKIKAHKL